MCGESRPVARQGWLRGRRNQEEPMRQSSRAIAYVALFVGLMIVPAAALAQSGTAAIAGIVKDASGSVMSGVTVEASSPALIENRTVVTDGSGQYKIVALPLGTYTVTMTLSGFS